MNIIFVQNTFHGTNFEIWNGLLNILVEKVERTSWRRVYRSCSFSLGETQVSALKWSTNSVSYLSCFVFFISISDVILGFTKIRKDLIQLNSIRWYHWLQKNFDPGWPRRAEPCWEPSSLASPAFALWMELSHLDGIANSNSTKLISMLSQCRPARFESSFISRMKYSAGRNMCPGQKGRLSDVCKMLSGAATRGIGLVHGNCQVKKLERSRPGQEVLVSHHLKEKPV